MTVGQLIDRLKEFDRDTHVVILAEDDYGHAICNTIDPENIYITDEGDLVINAGV